MLYSKLFSLANAHATGSFDTILSIRSPDARHSWGHNHLKSTNASLQDVMDNAAFASHLKSTGPLLTVASAKVHDILIDEMKRKATIHMSYYLVPVGDSNEVVENDLIWLLTFTGSGEVQDDPEAVLIKNSIEFIDATASARIGVLIKATQGPLKQGVRGGVGVILEGQS
jgi:hypothetical protein